MFSLVERQIVKVEVYCLRKVPKYSKEEGCSPL